MFYKKINNPVIVQISLPHGTISFIVWIPSSGLWEINLTQKVRGNITNCQSSKESPSSLFVLHREGVAQGIYNGLLNDTTSLVHNS
jgi:hypothetical protein